MPGFWQRSGIQVKASFSCSMWVCCRWLGKWLCNLEVISLIGLFRLGWCTSRSRHPAWWLLDLGYESQQCGPKALHSPTTREGLHSHGQQICTLVFSSIRWEDNPFMVFLYSFLSNLSIEFYDDLRDGRQGMTPSKGQSWSSYSFPSSFGAAKKKGFHVIARNNKIPLTSLATLETSQPACRSSPTLRYRWLPNIHFLHTKLGK